MNLGSIWGELSTQERRCIHRAVLQYDNGNHILTRYPSRKNLPYNKLSFLSIDYVLHCMMDYRLGTPQKQAIEALKIKNIIMKLKSVS